VDQPAAAPTVLLANEPRAYREALAAAVRLRCPAAVVRELDAADLDAAVARERPDLVVCSAASAAVEAGAPAWVLLYPGGARAAVVAAAGRVRVLPDLALDDLLGLLDPARCAAA
jgi:hypothetical protein